MLAAVAEEPWPPGQGWSMLGGIKELAPLQLLQHLLEEKGTSHLCGHCEERAPHQHAQPKIIPPNNFGSPVRSKPCILRGA